jgi:ubiquinone/menaquinone biosynthesis C-methylase UbiE
VTSESQPKVSWDYTDLAATYDKRADYAGEAIAQLLELAKPDPARPVADVGAGTAKLTKLLLAAGFEVHAVEPNAAMRAHGVENTAGGRVTWSVGTGEATGLADSTYDLVTFGSSFNVTDRAATLREVVRILRPRGWFACMWNHRDLEDPIQAEVEGLIRAAIPGYSYGSRREDQTEVIRASGLFEDSTRITGRIDNEIATADYVEAWRSHATLQRQAGEGFLPLVEKISAALAEKETIVVPYTTQMWVAQAKA